MSVSSSEIAVPRASSGLVNLYLWKTEMKRSSFLISGVVLLFLLFSVSSQSLCFGQEKQVADGSCDGIDLQQAGFSVRSTRISDPFDFLPWVRARQRRAAAKIAALVNGKPFRYSDVRDTALKIIEEENFLPDTSETRIKIRLELVSLENCSNKSVDVIYGVYSTQLMPVLSAAPEKRAQERTDPEEAAGLEKVDAPEVRPIKFRPTGGYDSTQKLFGGARLEIRQRQPSGLVNSAIIEGQGSAQMHSISAKLIGSRDDLGLLAHLDWNVDFSNFSIPTGTGRLEGGHLSANIFGTSRPLVNGNLIFRFGGMVEGGNRQSDLINPQLTADTIADSPFGAAKLFVGVASRFKHHSLSASYGLQLGAAGRAVRVDWAKHIADVQHEFWYSGSNHRVIDLESRLTLGFISVPGKIPLAERFFGGNHEETFMASDSWLIRANPVIRAIPGSRLFRTPSGDGGDRFFSYNFTGAYSIWQMPLVPSELSRDEEFRSLANAQLINVESFLELHFLTKDPHFFKVAEFIQKPEGNPTVQAALANLSTVVTAAQTSHPGQHDDEFEACIDAIDDAESRARNGAKAKGERQYGYIQALLSVDDEDLLNGVIKACVTTLNGDGVLNGDPAIAAAGSRLEQIRTQMQTEFSQIDQETAKLQAREDMVFVRRTFNTLMNEVNIYSISPVVVFDIAQLKSKGVGTGGLRYGPGLGLRLDLASAVSFTGGYAWNVKSSPGEGRGSFFFSMKVRDLFR